MTSLDDKFKINKKFVKNLINERGLSNAIKYMEDIPEKQVSKYYKILKKQIKKQVKIKSVRYQHLTELDNAYENLISSY